MHGTRYNSLLSTHHKPDSESPPISYPDPTHPSSSGRPCFQALGRDRARTMFISSESCAEGSEMESGSLVALTMSASSAGRRAAILAAVSRSIFRLILVMDFRRVNQLVEIVGVLCHGKWMRIVTGNVIGQSWQYLFIVLSQTKIGRKCHHNS